MGWQLADIAAAGVAAEARSWQTAAAADRRERPRPTAAAAKAIQDRLVVSPTDNSKLKKLR